MKNSALQFSYSSFAWEKLFTTYQIKIFGKVVYGSDIFSIYGTWIQLLREAWSLVNLNIPFCLLKKSSEILKYRHSIYG